MKNILITGGYGFLGGRVAQHLAEAGTGNIHLGISDPGRLPSLHKTFETRETRWTDSARLEEACKGIDTIIHLAGMDAAACARDPISALIYNGVYTGRLLEAAKKKGVSGFLFFSTAHVYASPLAGTITEQTPTLSLHPYATSNRAGEDLVRVLSADEAINSMVIRLSNSYGAPVSANVNCWHLLVNDLCRQAVTTKTLSLRSAGLQRRDFIPISEVCSVLSHFINQPLQPSGTILNVGGEWSPKVIEMTHFIAERCESLFGYQPAIQVPAAGLEEHTQPLHFSIEKLLSTGFIPSNDHTQEMDGLLQFCKRHFL